jgi:hypothetical protein
VHRQRTVGQGSVTAPRDFDGAEGLEMPGDILPVEQLKAAW